MKHYVYILYSQTADKFYVGETFDLLDRLTKHNSHFFTHAYTKIAQDWEFFFTIECDNISVARKIERHIKKMKSRKYILDIKRYPNITEKLLLKFAE